jgi:hypothetical protein
MSKFEIVKKLEHLIAFQASCLSEGWWKEFDITENEVKETEESILRWGEKNRNADSK